MPRTMTAEREQTARAGGPDATVLARELDAERAAHVQTKEELDCAYGHITNYGAKIFLLEEQKASIERRAKALAEALEREAIRRCLACGGGHKAYERVPKARSDGRFFHERHDGVSDGAWLCDAQNAVAALALYEKESK